MDHKEHFWRAVQPALAIAGGFSLFINLMLLAPVIYMLQVYDRVLANHSLPTLGMLTSIVFVALLAMSLVDMARGRLTMEAALRVDELLGERTLKRVIRNASTLHGSDYLHELKDIATIRAFFSGNNIIALFDAPWLIVFVVLIYYFHPYMGLVALFGAMLMMSVAVANEFANRKALQQYQDVTRQAGHFMDQGVRNADVLNSMGMTLRFAEQWKNINSVALDLLQRSSGRIGVFLSLSKLIRHGVQVAMMCLGAYLVIRENLTPGVMIAATILLGRALAPVESMIGNWSGLVAARGAYERLSKLFPEIFLDEIRQELLRPLGRLEAQQVYLSGFDKDHMILRAVNFVVPESKSLAILGPSGSGKSSLAKLIVGVWVPTAGHVRIDGADVKHWDRSQLGSNIGYLPQDVELFSGTISENIGRFDTSNSEAILHAANAAHAYDLIVRLPQGFDTRLGIGGIQLSAGQAQRIGLARALYGAPRIVVLDEPNANLDAEGELALQQAIADIKKAGSTVILITHKPSLIVNIDYLMVLRDGAVQLFGAKEDVLSKLNTYTPSTSTSQGETA